MPLPEETRDERLTLLGIDCSLNPTVSRMPKAYNPLAHTQWRQAVTELKLIRNSQTNWLNAIQNFKLACKDSNVEMYDLENIDNHNEGIADWLLSNRVKVIKFCDEIDLFKLFAIRSVTRTVKVLGAYGDRKFVVVNVARLKAIEDPTIEKWLTEAPLPGFLRLGPTVKIYKKEVNSAVTIEFNLSGKAPTVKMNILCHAIPMIPNRKGSVNLKAVAKYIEQDVWLPLVRRVKFKNVGSKLF